MTPRHANSGAVQVIYKARFQQPIHNSYLFEKNALKVKQDFKSAYIHLLRI